MPRLGVSRADARSLDLSRVVRDEVESGGGETATTYFRDELPYSGTDWIAMPEDFQDRMQQLTAADAMSRELVMVRPDATVDEIVRAMSKNRAHRVLVGEGRRLQGVITTFDLMRVVTRVTPGFTAPTGTPATAEQTSSERVRVEPDRWSKQPAHATSSRATQNPAARCM